MSNFECPVVRVSIESHPNADAIEIAVVGGFNCIVKKGQFKDGDLAVYVPEASVLPQWLLMRLGFWDELNSKGTLSGSKGNRVKAIKLRGVLSQGLLIDGPQKSTGAEDVSIAVLPAYSPFRVVTELTETECAAELLGITKYEPAVPVHMAGKIAGGDLDAAINYDFENIKKCLGLFEPGEQVVITEKIHGTFVQIGLIPEVIWRDKKWAPKLRSVFISGGEYKQVVTSKGQGAKGLLLDTEDVGNLYVGIGRGGDFWNKLARIRMTVSLPADQPIFLCGEIFGPGVQDGFTYGATAPKLQVFDIYVGTRSNGYFLDYGQVRQLCENFDLETVPLMYSGPFSDEILKFHTDGKTHITGMSGKPENIREGVVVKAARESRHSKYGRKIAKSLSEAYLLRKGKTTEFQ